LRLLFTHSTEEKGKKGHENKMRVGARSAKKKAVRSTSTKVMEFAMGTEPSVLSAKKKAVRSMSNKVEFVMGMEPSILSAKRQAARSTSNEVEFVTSIGLPL
jgi:hypothetical protein